MFLSLFFACLTFGVSASTEVEKALIQSLIEKSNVVKIEELLTNHRVPGVSIAIIKEQKLVFAQGYGVTQAGSQELVNENTLFSVGSISKVGAATITLGMADKKLLDLDADINRYLTLWKVPENRLTQDSPVTLAHVLSHTAGFSVHGFADFQPGEKLPSTLEIINGNGYSKNSPVRVLFRPGSQYRYSGGGTTVQQLILEEILKKDFPQIAKENLFNQLGMSRSTYQNPVPESVINVAKAHNRNGKPRALPRGYEAMPEMAASGLWTTPIELSKLVIALMESYQGKEKSFLSQNLAKRMMKPVFPGEFGLGPIVKPNGIFEHGGSNDSYKALFKGSLKNGNGYIVFTNGANGQRLINELSVALDSLLF